MTVHPNLYLGKDFRPQRAPLHPPARAQSVGRSASSHSPRCRRMVLCRQGEFVYEVVGKLYPLVEGGRMVAPYKIRTGTSMDLCVRSRGATFLALV